MGTVPYFGSKENPISNESLFLLLTGDDAESESLSPPPACAVGVAVVLSDETLTGTKTNNHVVPHHTSTITIILKGLYPTSISSIDRMFGL